MSGALEILATGPLTLVQDLGRPGFAALGVGRSGAADRTAYRLGTRLVAHSEGRAALEVVLGGLAARIVGNLTLALTGAAAPASVDDHPVPHAAPLHLDDGQVLRLGMPSAGLRTYVSVRGGLGVPTVLGSASTDTLSGLGPDPVRAGDVLSVADYLGEFPNVDVAPVELPFGGQVVLDVLPGPRLDWFADAAMLLEQTWQVSSDSNRVGVRLEGEPLARTADHQDQELPSEGMVRGCLQVPPSGQPVLFLADHPVTGGYPVIAVVTSTDVDRAAQLQPGQEVRLRWRH
ncbi:MAG: biotin-dependent carboxyltransferase family protein [Actinobacteria bacterium]|nr:biotin-dependent carboxyltransferase family protein [Actinomycetota bacterium]